MMPNGSMQPRFKLRHAVIGYIVALVFTFNGLLTSVIDATLGHRRRLVRAHHLPRRADTRPTGAAGTGPKRPRKHMRL